MTRIGFSLSTVLARIRWYGEDSDRFRRDWNTVLRRTLQTVAAELDTVAKLLALNADEQELASIGSDLGGRILPMDGAHAPVTETLAEKISGMDSKELDSSLKSDEFQEWVRQSQHNADAAKSVLDGMADSGGLRTAGTDGRPNGYGEFLQQYWVESAMREAGIDPHHWDPSKGVDHNREDIYKVYAFYAKLYKNDPRMEWIGMANQVGPTFIAGFEDIAVLHKAVAAGKDIGSQHHAFQPGGLAEIERLQRAGLVTANMDEAWRRIDAVPAYRDPGEYHNLTLPNKKSCTTLPTTSPTSSRTMSSPTTTTISGIVPPA